MRLLSHSHVCSLPLSIIESPYRFMIRIMHPVQCSFFSEYVARSALLLISNFWCHYAEAVQNLLATVQRLVSMTFCFLFRGTLARTQECARLWDGTVLDSVWACTVFSRSTVHWFFSTLLRYVSSIAWLCGTRAQLWPCPVGIALLSGRLSDHLTAACYVVKELGA